MGINLNETCEHDYLKYYKPQQSDNIIDAGATFAEFGIEHRKVLKAHDIFVMHIEPWPWAAEKIAQWLMHPEAPRGSVLTSGLWSEPGIKVFNVCDAAVCNSLTDHAGSTYMKFPVRAQLSVPVVTLDQIIDMLGGSIGLLKMDIEGGEQAAIEACTKIDRIRHLAIASYHIVDGNPTWKRLVPFLESKGFTVVHECPLKAPTECQDMVYAWRNQ